MSIHGKGFNPQGGGFASLIINGEEVSCEEIESLRQQLATTERLLAESQARNAEEQDRMRKDAARYNWLVSKVFCRGETCLALYEEFGGAPFQGETVRQFMDRYIDAARNAAPDRLADELKGGEQG